MKSAKKIFQKLNTPTFFRKVSSAAAIALLAGTVGLVGAAGITLEKAQKELDQIEEKKHSLALAQAARENDAKVVSALTELDVALRSHDYSELVSFFQSSQEFFQSGIYFVQNGNVCLEEGVEAGSKVLILDMDSASFYSGTVDENGLRSGQGIQFGYSPAYARTDASAQVQVMPAIHIYEGSFENNLANGTGTYQTITQPGTDQEEAIVQSGTFTDSRADGQVQISWSEEGKTYSDVIEPVMGTYPVKLKWKNEAIYAGSWNRLSYRRLSVWNMNEITDTMIFHAYLKRYDGFQTETAGVSLI